MTIVTVLLLLGVANGAPILLNKLLDRRFVLQFCETTTRAKTEQHGPRPRSDPGSVASHRRSGLLPRTYPPRCGFDRGPVFLARDDPFAALVSAQHPQAAVLNSAYVARCNRCKVISGRQLSRTSTMDEPVPTEV